MAIPKFTSPSRQLAYENLRLLRDEKVITRAEFSKRVQKIIDRERKAREKKRVEDIARRAQQERTRFLSSIRLRPGRGRTALGSITSRLFTFDPAVTIAENDVKDRVVDEVMRVVNTVGFSTNTKVLVKLRINVIGGMGWFSTGTASINEPEARAKVRDSIDNFTGRSIESDVVLEIDSVDVIVYPRTPLEAGCDSNTHHKKIGDMKVCSPKSTNQNCLFACIHQHLGKRMYAESVRKELGIPTNTPIRLEQIDMIAKHYGITVSLYDLDGNHVNDYNPGLPKCNIMNWVLDDGKGHFVLIEGEVKQCEQCGKSWIHKHTCNLRRRMWVSRMSGKRIVINNEKALRDEPFDCNKMLYYDLETFRPEDTDAITPYAASWYCDGKYYQKYGENSWNDFVNFLLTKQDKIVCAYNGAGFDFHFLMNEMIMRGMDVKDTIINNGRILSFTFGEKMRCWDLCLFTLSSLKDACKDFKVSDDNTKTEFDHFKIKSWEDVHKYRDEVEPYIKRDVLGMKEVFEKFSAMVYDLFKVHMTEFITLSAMSYAIWTQSVKEILELPDTTKYEFIRESLYGGRTYPMVREFTSKHYYDIVENQDDPAKLKDIYKTMDDWIFNADVTSLYPTAMVNFEYPVGHSKWVSESMVDVNNLQCGIYDVEIETNKNLIVPILPTKMGNGGISWDLYDRRGVYTSTDLQNALKFGYKITKVHKGLVWEKTANIFNEYIQKCYKIKSENEDNPVLRQVGKILMNALYGKMLERARFEENKFCNNINDVYLFTRDFDTTDIQFIKDKVVMIGIPKDKSISDDRVRKPSQVGTFILSFSRRIMLNAMTAICPTLDKHFFTYTDTDSLHIHASTLPGLKEKGWLEKGLGNLSDDAKGGKIFREINLAPKLYMYLCLMPDGKIKNVMKSKGIPQAYLSPHLFEHADDLDDSEKVIVMKNRLKKVGFGRHIQRDYRCYDAFSILSIDMERTFYKNQWQGMEFVEGKWFPKK
jgi:DNA polymerase elongation subunit (family B)